MNKTSRNRRSSTSRLIEAIRKEDVHWLLHLLKGTEATQNELDEALHTAAWLGQNESVQVLLAAGASLQSVSQHQEPLLVVAVYSGSVEVVRTILQAEYDISSVAGYDKWIPNPLHLAVSSREKPNYEMVDLLLEAGLDPECKDVDGDTPLISACNMGDVTLARKFLSARCQIDAFGYEGNTALHRAVEAGSVELVELLTEHKADVNAVNSIGNTPLMVACQCGNDILARTLLNNGDNSVASRRNVDGKNCFHLAASSGKVELIDLLMDVGVPLGDVDKAGNTPLILSIQEQNSEFAGRLLDFIVLKGNATMKQVIAVQGELLRTALHWAALYDMVVLSERLIEASEGSGFIDLRDAVGDSALILAAKANSQHILPLLIKRNSAVDIKGELGRTALHWSVQCGDAEATEDLLSAPGMDINACDEVGNTSIILAALNRRGKEVLRLAQRGADLNVRGEYGRTVLHWLCLTGQKEIIGELKAIMKSSSVDANITDKDGETALLLALRNKKSDAAAEMLSYPSHSWKCPLDFNCVNSVGSQALHYAAAEGFTEIVQLLVTTTTDINRRDNAGCSAVILACRNKHESVIRTLIESGCDVNVTDNEQRTPLFYAAQNGLRDSVQKLIESGADPDLKRSEPSPLIQAAKIGSTECVGFLVASGAGVNHCNGQKRTALMWAAQGGFVEIIRNLLNHGASALTEDASGDTALTIAAWNGYNEAVRILAPVADLEHRERDEGMTALHLAIAKDSSDTVSTLLHSGSDVNALDAKGNNCLLTAMIHTSGSQIVSMLLRQCPLLDVNFVGDQGRSALHWAVGDQECLNMVIERKPDIDLVDCNGASPLLLAIAHSKPESAKILIDAGADFRKMHKDGRAAIHHAAIYGVTEVVELLLSRGLEPDTPTEDGKTPILLASVEGHVDIVRILIKHGSDVNHVYLDAMTPLSMAASGRHHKVMDVLLEAGADPNLFGSKKCSPLMTSILNNDIEGTAILIQHGVKLDQVTEEDKHPIHGAMVNNYVAILRLLVSVECDVNFLRRLLKEGIIYYFVDDDHFLTELRSLSKAPKSLKMLCRSGIRRRLTIPLIERISQLPVPKIMHDYLAMKEII